MSAVFRAARGGLGGRKLHAVIIGLVVLVATAASTLALGMLADAHSPFDHAFASQNGAHAAVTVNTSAATAGQITAATKVKGVTAVAGPFASANVDAQVSLPRISGTVGNPMNFVGRSSPGGPVDDLTLQQGRWATSDNQIVISSNAPGHRLRRRRPVLVRPGADLRGLVLPVREHSRDRRQHPLPYRHQHRGR
jgi:putative ABC transport system permease protein